MTKKDSKCTATRHKNLAKIEIEDQGGFTNEGTLKEKVDFIFCLCDFLGIRLNDKNITKPMKKFQWIGWQYEEGRVKPTERRIEKLLKKLTLIMESPTATYRQISSIRSSISSMQEKFPFARILCNYLSSLFREGSYSFGAKNWADETLVITPEIKGIFADWLHFFLKSHKQNKDDVFKGGVKVVVSTYVIADTGSVASGAFIWQDGAPQRTSLSRSRVPDYLLDVSSTYKEVWGIWDYLYKRRHILSSWGPITIVCDSWGAIAGIMFKGSSVDPELNKLIIKIHTLLDSLKIPFCAIWSKRSSPLVMVADSLTRICDNLTSYWRERALEKLHHAVHTELLPIGMSCKQILEVSAYHWLEKKLEKMTGQPHLYVLPHDLLCINNFFTFAKIYELRGTMLLPNWSSLLNLKTHCRSSYFQVWSTFKWKDCLTYVNPRWRRYRGFIVKFSFEKKSC